METKKKWGRKPVFHTGHVHFDRLLSYEHNLTEEIRVELWEMKALVFLELDPYSYGLKSGYLSLCCFNLVKSFVFVFLFLFISYIITLFSMRECPINTYIK